MVSQEIKVEHHISPTGSLYYTASYSPSPNYCGFGMTPEEAVSDLQKYRESLDKFSKFCKENKDSLISENLRGFDIFKKVR